MLDPISRVAHGPTDLDEDVLVAGTAYLLVFTLLTWILPVARRLIANAWRWLGAHRDEIAVQVVSGLILVALTAVGALCCALLLHLLEHGLTALAVTASATAALGAAAKAARERGARPLAPA